MNKGTILSVDDDENLQIVIEQYLNDNGYAVKTAHNVEQARALFQDHSFDVALLDLNLPDGEGLSLIPQFQVDSNCGLIVVSGKTDTTEKIVCLEMGADDYLTKPFEMRELSARIKAVIRRREVQGGVKQDHKPVSVTDDHRKDVIEFAHWRLDRAQYQVFDANNKSIGLTTGEFKLLDILISSPDRVMSRERLFELTREEEYDVFDRAVDTQIARIRKKLGDEASQIIQTVRGVGYKFSASHS